MNKQEVQDVIIPGPSLYTIPTCKVCGTPLIFDHVIHDDQQEWAQGCSCSPEAVGTGSIWSDGKGRRIATQTVNVSMVGKPLYERCWHCNTSMMPGESAKYGAVGSYYGYAHGVCYQQWLEKQLRIQADAERARAGVHIGVRFSVDIPEDHPSKLAPTTGHPNLLEVRELPYNLPELPAGVVAYALFRRPVAATRLEFPDRTQAESWWKEATGIPDAFYALTWFDSETEQKANRCWTGTRFSSVIAHAHYVELSNTPDR